MLKAHKITPVLWFDGQAEAAVKHYTSIFKNSKIGTTSRFMEVGPGPKDSVMTITFELDGQPLVALNGGPQFKFTEAVSLMVSCDTQAEIDHYWEKLGAGGEYGPCGWLKDKFGLSWQVAPNALFDMILDKDRARANRAFAAMMKMGKLDIAALQAAFDGRCRNDPNQGDRPMLETPHIAKTEPCLIASIRLCVPWSEMRAVMGPGLAEVKTAVAAQGLKTPGPWFNHHFRKPTETLDFEICVPVATPIVAIGRVTAGELPSATVARAVFHGNYGGLGKAWGELANWIVANGHTPAADFWECYAIGPETSADAANWRTQLNWPLTATKLGHAR